MRNLTKLLGITALAAVIGFAMAGCEQPTDSPTGKTLTSITLNTDSVKKAYAHNETLDLSGLVVTANYSDSTSAAVTGYTSSLANGATLSTAGTIPVTVSYTEGAVTKTADFSVTVTPATPTLTGITANYTGTSHIYTFTLLDSLKDHLTVTAQYNDGSEQPVNEYTLSGNLTAGTSTITVTYEDKETTFTVTVTAATLDSIAVTFNQNAATIYTSTPLDNLKQYLTIKATYTFTGSQETHEETLSSAHEYTLSGTLTVGTPTITVNYSNKSGTFTPTVTAVVLASITAQYNNSTAAIYTSTPLDNLKQYLTVKAAYNDGNEKTLTANEYTLSGTLTAGMPTVTVTYESQTATFTPTVTAVILDSITANYTGGDVEINSNIDDLKDALTVTAHYNDGTSATLDAEDYTLSGDVTAIGQKTITASYTDGGVTKTDTFTVTVVCTIHDWQWTPLTPATCTTAGSEIETCSLCGITGETTRQTSIDPNAHDFEFISTATETEDGEEGMICTREHSHKQGSTTIAYATGTAGLSFTAISIDSGTNNAYRVSRGTATGAIVIPAYHRPDVNSPYLLVREIGNGTNLTDSNAFGGTYSGANFTVTNITFVAGSQLTTISSFAFFRCQNLTSVTIPASVTTIGNGAFYYCSSLTSIIIPESITSIVTDMFNSCTSLASIIIPAGITSIGRSAFNYCSSLTSITIPEGVTYIGEYAFNGCTSLASITIPASVTSVGEYSGVVFGDWTNTQTINVPFANADATPAGWNANWNKGRWNGGYVEIDAVIKYWNGTTWE